MPSGLATEVSENSWDGGTSLLPGIERPSEEEVVVLRLDAWARQRASGFAAKWGEMDGDEKEAAIREWRLDEFFLLRRDLQPGFYREVARLALNSRRRSRHRDLVRLCIQILLAPGGIVEPRILERGASRQDRAAFRKRLQRTYHRDFADFFVSTTGDTWDDQRVTRLMSVLSPGVKLAPPPPKELARHLVVLDRTRVQTDRFRRAPAMYFALPEYSLSLQDLREHSLACLKSTPPDPVFGRRAALLNEALRNFGPFLLLFHSYMSMAVHLDMFRQRTVASRDEWIRSPKHFEYTAEDARLARDQLGKLADSGVATRLLKDAADVLKREGYEQAASFVDQTIVGSSP